jgi:small GTP-binding protein
MLDPTFRVSQGTGMTVRASVKIDRTEGAPPPSPTVVKRKVCFIGEEGVGKTSLVRRFVTGKFDEDYIRTLGAVASKKSIDLVESALGAVHVDLMILDIVGKRTFMQLFRDAYLKGAAGILAVFDLTRRASLVELAPWIDAARQELGGIPILALGNKADLTAQIRVSEEDIEAVLAPRDVRVIRTSARTGDNVGEAFLRLAREILLESR